MTAIGNLDILAVNVDREGVSTSGIDYKSAFIEQDLAIKKLETELKREVLEG